ncbi:class I SAM-dependent methyltransferase [Paenibacillus sp. GCM10012307]|uniref:Class I SAM-dependent methyltransferase n=1 Tax=Paenibacillus roseus TaxID=2798579 RepID=A0A934MQH2_9BACL|nr:class I SAM-dependent methyltransferase [Paenibacillus roseus]MBJ6361374.1 class I SAM-dependent methyltransferase [Paenibacillus roseus]
MTKQTKRQATQVYRAYWDKGADIYDSIIDKEIADGAYGKWEQLIREQLGRKSESRLSVLDVGTGPCFFGILLSRMGHRVTAIDSSPEMIAKARHNADKYGCDINIVEADMMEYRRSDPFDLVISRNVTWFLANPAGAYKGWYEMLKPDGEVHIFDANWNLHLTDPKEALLYQQAHQEAVDKGYIPYREEAEIAEGNELYVTLPLSYVKRPSWDVEMLTAIGFNRVEVRSGFDQPFYSTGEQILNRHRPMFAIKAVK